MTPPAADKASKRPQAGPPLPDSWLCAPVFCFRCIVFGWLLWPINAVKCCFFRDDRGLRIQSRICCKPAKVFCNSNGRNGKFFIPFAVLEICGFLLGAFALYTSLVIDKHPFAYIDANILTNKANVTFDAENYWKAVGTYDHWYQKTMLLNTSYLPETPNSKYVQTYTLFDKAQIQTWPSAFADENDPDYESEVVIAQRISDATNGNYSGSTADFMMISYYCICRGWFPAGADLDTSCMSSANPTATKSFCKPMVAGANIAYGHNGFVDIPTNIAGFLADAVDPVYKIIILGGVLMNFCRAYLILFDKEELKKPGTQWMCGIWAFFFFMAMTQIFDGLLGKLSNPEFSSGKYSQDIQKGYVEADDGYKILGYAGYSLAVSIATTKSMLLYSAIISLPQMWISERSYCPDCTHYAYTKTSIEVITSRREKMV